MADVTMLDLSGRIAVLLMAYGTPRSPDEIEPYYTDIRRGRPPTAEQLADLVGRYEAIGGVSPLAQRTVAQRDALQRALDALAPDTYTVAVGLKHADPKIETTIERARRSGHRADRRRGDGPPLLGRVGRPVPRTHTRRGRGLAASTSSRSRAGPPSRRSSTSSPPMCGAGWRRCRRTPRHCSPPTRCRRGSSPAAIPIPDELDATADAVASAAGLGEWSQWAIAWQSAGRTPEPWIGPDILAVIDDLAAVGGRRRGARLRVRLRRRSPRGALRPRHRGPPAGRIARPRVRPHGLRQRRSGGDRRPGGSYARAGEPLMPTSGGRRVLVVGGGITGLATAEALVTGGADVTVREADATLGGKIRTSTFAGLAIDEGADAFLARTPEAVQLAERVGLAGLTSPTDATAAVWHDGLHDIPGAIVLGVPAGAGAVRHDRAAVVARQAAGRLRTVPSAHVDGRRRARLLRQATLRRRGPRAPRRRARRQHLRNRHRQRQPRRRPAAGRAGGQRPEPAAHRPVGACPGEQARCAGPDLRRSDVRRRRPRRRRGRGRAGRWRRDPHVEPGRQHRTRRRHVGGRR